MIPVPVPDLARTARPLTRLVAMGPPAGVPDEECGTVQMLISHEVLPRIGRAHYAYFKPTAEELAALNDGAYLELAQYGNGVQPFGLLVQGFVPVEVIATSEHARTVGSYGQEQWRYAARELIVGERRRQINEEGYSTEHDREHPPAELLGAARAYLIAAVGMNEITPEPECWPWAPSEWNPKGPVENFARAGALFMAELDLARLEPAEDISVQEELEQAVSGLAQHLRLAHTDEVRSRQAEEHLGREQ